MRTIKTIAALACILLVSCHSQPTTSVEKIEALKKQVQSDAKALQDLDDTYFPKLQQDFLYCDSLLQYLPAEQVDADFAQLNLAQAYMGQFGDVKPMMQHKMDYLLLQLDRLKSDAESHYLSDSLVLVYLETEQRVADTIHAQLEYFQTRLQGSEETFDKLKKSN